MRFDLAKQPSVAAPRFPPCNRRQDSSYVNFIAADAPQRAAIVGLRFFAGDDDADLQGAGER
jgi:hypothetical protein